VNPTKDLEVGFTRSSIWAGVGHPFTFDSLLRNFGSVSSPLGESSAFGNRNDPGDRKSGFDFSYRIACIANWLTLYSVSKIIKARFRRVRIKRNERWTPRQKFKASQSRSTGAGLYQISGVLVDAVRSHPLQGARVALSPTWTKQRHLGPMIPKPAAACHRILNDKGRYRQQRSILETAPLSCSPC
jgi:hypothetical protein